MALKHKIKQSDYDKLSDELKNEYIAGDADGEFVLDVSGLPEPEDTGPIKRARDAEKAKAADLKRQLSEAQAKLDAMPDVDALKAEHETKTKKLSDFAEKTLRTSKAMEVATKISTAPSLLADKIAARLQVDLSGDEPKTVILGKDGKPDAALDFDKLSQEFVANPEYKAIIIASKASGGGAPKVALKTNGGGAPVGNSGEQTFDASKATGGELAARIAARKEAAANAQP